MPLFQNECKCKNEFDLHKMNLLLSVGGTHFHTMNVVPRSTMNTNGETEN